MSAPGRKSATLACPACAEGAVHLFPASRKSGSVVGACAACGCHWLTNPPAAGEVLDNYAYDRDVYESWVNIKRQDSLHTSYEATLHRLDQLIESGGRTLFDVGAGAGEFLLLARQKGFEPYGNEFAPGAIELTKERTGIDLHVGDLATIEGSNLYDSVTMWCVLAHVRYPDDLMAHVLRVLKPGGVLFLQTPRWSAMDTAGLAAVRASSGRLARLLDRRVNDFHMVLNSRRSLAAHAERLGFDVVEVRPRARYSLNTYEYLRSLGLPERVRGATARVLDVAVDRDIFFRNVLDLYARKPHTSSPGLGR